MNRLYFLRFCLYWSKICKLVGFNNFLELTPILFWLLLLLSMNRRSLSDYQLPPIISSREFVRPALGALSRSQAVISLLLVLLLLLSFSSRILFVRSVCSVGYLITRQGGASTLPKHSQTFFSVGALLEMESGWFFHLLIQLE